MNTAAEEILEHLTAISFVAGRDARAALPAVEPLGDAAAERYLDVGRDLFFYDREAGKAYFHHTAALVSAFGGLEPWLTQADAFRQFRGTWKALTAFLEQAPKLRERFGVAVETRWYETGFAYVASHVDSGAAFFRTPFTEMAGEQGDLARMESLLAPSRELLNQRVGLATYLKGALRIREMTDDAELQQWARRGMDILQSGRLRGEAYFRLESEESLSFLLDVLPGFRTRSQQRLLSLLLKAWFGFDLPLEDSGWSPEKGRAFIETDGRHLFLPAVMPDREEAMLGLLHAAGHIHAGSYDQDAIQALFAEMGSKHPPLDKDQLRITWRPLFANFGQDMIRFQLIFDLCEDLRVDWRVAREVPGYLGRMVKAALALGNPDGPAGVYYAAALEQVKGLLGQASLPWRLKPLLEPSAGIVDSFRIALAWYQEDTFPPITLDQRAAAFLPGRSPNAARPVFPTFKGKPAGDSNADEGGLLGQTHPEEGKRDMPDKAAGEDPDFDVPPEDTSGQGGRIGAGKPMPTKVTGKGRGFRKTEGGIPYPEWDYREARLKSGWARVHLRQLQEADAETAEQLMLQYRGALLRLKRAIQAQKPTRLAPLRRQMEGEEIDIEAAVQFVAERHAGHSPKANVYRQRRPQQRDTSVLLLADLSTSIMAQLPEAGGRIVDRLRAAMLLFAEALNEVGDPYALYGFASKYRDNVSVYPIKRFQDPLNAKVRATIGGLSGRLATRMGAAIRHSTGLLQQSPAQRRLLLILSDGRPSDYDDGGDIRYLHEDTRMAVKAAVDAGVHPFCITLDPQGGQYLPGIFGPGHYLVLDHMDSLPARLPELYLRLRRA